MSLPYFPMFPTDFEAKTSHLTLAEDGAYNRLLRLAWMTPGCSLPADRAWIYRRVRAHTEADQAVVEIVIAEFFDLKNGRLSNARLSKEFAAANEAHERRKNAGAKGGKAKALKTNETAPSNATPMLKQPEPEPEPFITIEGKPSIVPPDIEPPKRNGRVRGAARKCQLPKDWQPNEANYAFASKSGLTREEINHEADQFRNHALAQGRLALDWHAAFQTWLGNTVKWRAERSARTLAGSNASGKPGGGGLVAAGLRAVSQARGYGEPVPGDGGMGAGYVIDGDQLRFGRS